MPIIVVIFVMKLELCRQNFEKYSIIEFHENPFTWSWVASHGQTYRQTHT